MSSSRSERGDHGVARLITASANQLWAAGLGALTLAEREGLRFFDQLARLGERDDEAQAKAEANAPEGAAGPRLPASVLHRLEEMIEQRVTRALNALQIPTARDVQELSERVEALAKAVDELAAGSPAPAAKPARTAPTTRRKKPTASRSKTAATKKKKTPARKKPASPTRTTGKKAAATRRKASTRRKTATRKTGKTKKRAVRRVRTARD